MSGADIQRHVSEVTAQGAVGSFAVGFTIGQLNSYLQAFSLICGSVLSIVASIYYYKRWRNDNK